MFDARKQNIKIELEGGKAALKKVPDCSNLWVYEKTSKRRSSSNRDYESINKISTISKIELAKSTSNASVNFKPAIPANKNIINPSDDFEKRQALPNSDNNKDTSDEEQSQERCKERP